MESEEKPARLGLRERFGQLSPLQRTLIIGGIVTAVLALVLVGGFTHFFRMLVMLFIDVVVRVARLIFRF